MVSQVTISGDITSIFDKQKLENVLNELKAQAKETKDEYQLGFWKVNGITVVLYEKKIVFQCPNSEHNHEILSKIVSVEGIDFDNKNKIIIASMSPKRQNAIICKQCYKPSLTIETEIEGLQVKFKKECTHTDEMNSPLFTINYRLFPDINILVSRSLSRLIGLGHFSDYEVIIPKFIMNVIDTLDGGTKKGAHFEVDMLKSLETEGKIRVINYDDKYSEEDVTKYLGQEDNYLSEISDITNSILITGDENLKSKVQLKNRPVIYVNPKVHSQIKTMSETRKV